MNLLRRSAALALTAVGVAAAPAAVAAEVPATPVTPAGPTAATLPLATADDGTAEFCLTAQAAAALTTAGLTMTATAPATIATDPASGLPCFTASSLHAEVTLDLSAGGFAFPGAVVFTRASDGAALTVGDLAIKFGLTSELVGSVDGVAEDQIVLATFTVNPLNVHFDPVSSVLSADNTPLNITDAGAAAFQQAFGTSPWASGSPILIGSGHGAVTIPAISPVTGLASQVFKPLGVVLNSK